MHALFLPLMICASVASADLASSVQRHISASAQPWAIKNSRQLRTLLGSETAEAVFEVELNRKAGFTRIRSSLSSGNPKLDRLTRGLFGVLPRLRRVPPWLGRARWNTPCLVHFILRGEPASVDTSVACMRHRGTTELAAPDYLDLQSPARHLFEGWQHDLHGDVSKAIFSFRQATEEAPEWNFAALTMGLMLGRVGRYERAQPYLKQCIETRKPTAEVRAYLNNEPFSPEQDSSASVDGGDLTVASCQRDEREIFGHVRRRVSRLNKCIEQERDRNPTAQFPSTLSVRFKVTPPGKLRDIGIAHRFYQEGPLLSCVQRALRGKFNPRGGSDCITQFDLDISSVHYTEDR